MNTHKFVNNYYHMGGNNRQPQFKFTSSRQCGNHGGEWDRENAGYVGVRRERKVITLYNNHTV